MAKTLPNAHLLIAPFVRREAVLSSQIEGTQAGDLLAVEEQSRDAVSRSAKLLELRQQYRRRFESARSSALLLTLVDDLFETPVVTIPNAAKRLKVTHRAATLNVLKLVDAGILHEVTGRERSRIYVSRGIMKILEQRRQPPR